jgi:hypothetical protein
MGFEDKFNKMQPVITGKNKAEKNREPRISKSYTLKRELAEKLSAEADNEDLTASRYLEKILKKHFQE